MTILDLGSVHEGLSFEERKDEQLWTALNSSHFFLIFFLSLVSRQFLFYLRQWDFYTKCLNLG